MNEEALFGHSPGTARAAGTVGSVIGFLLLFGCGMVFHTSIRNQADAMTWPRPSLGCVTRNSAR